jgi:hypothetical protein
MPLVFALVSDELCANGAGSMRATAATNALSHEGGHREGLGIARAKPF